MIRDVGFLRWKPSNTWMESMNGPEWDALVQKENSLFVNMLSSVASKSDVVQKAYEFKDAHQTIVYKYKNLHIAQDGHEYSWSKTGENFTDYTVCDLDTDEKYVYQIRDKSNGSQKYSLECVSDSKIIWHLDNVGSSVFLKKSNCYLLGATNTLIYNSLLLVSDGRVETLYVEKDKKFSLRLEKRGTDLFLVRYSAAYEELYYVADKLYRLSSEATSFYPIGVYKNKLCYFAYIDSWVAVGFNFPYSFQNMIEYVSLEDSILILRHYGSKRVYNFKDKLKLVDNFYGDLYVNPWTLKLENSYVSTPGKGLTSFYSNDCKSSYGTVKRYFAVSKDSRRVPYIVVRPLCKIKSLMVIAYGAYGLPTNLSTERWKPYLEDGWCIVFALVRGSGDHTVKWASDAKTVKKITSYYDLEACIKYAQKLLHISPEETCVYGRSAGGYLLGIAISQTNGSLFKMAYAEVPYVDVLHTSTNPNLPLTALEYDEFGNPSKSIYEFETILNLSPVDSLNYNNPPDLAIVCNTGINDKEVYAYESLKWIEALRGKDKDSSRKLVSVLENQGHFFKGFTRYMNYSSNFYLLNSFRYEHGNVKRRIKK